MKIESAIAKKVIKALLGFDFIQYVCIIFIEKVFFMLINLYFPVLFAGPGIGTFSVYKGLPVGYRA